MRQFVGGVPPLKETVEPEGLLATFAQNHPVAIWNDYKSQVTSFNRSNILGD